MPRTCFSIVDLVLQALSEALRRVEKSFQPYTGTQDVLNLWPEGLSCCPKCGCVLVHTPTHEGVPPAGFPVATVQVPNPNSQILLLGKTASIARLWGVKQREVVWGDVGDTARTRLRRRKHSPGGVM